MGGDGGNSWEVCVSGSPDGFEQVSFVNSIATSRGGNHVNAVTGYGSSLSLTLSLS